MKKLLIILLLLPVTQLSKAQNDFDDKQALLILKKFYTEYMTAIASNDPKASSQNMRKCDLLKKEYCTRKLLNNIPKLAELRDCDPIINAQDSRMDCVKNLSVTKNTIKPNAYTVSYFYIDDYSKKKETFNINMVVVKQNEKYKIDSIWF